MAQQRWGCPSSVPPGPASSKAGQVFHIQGIHTYTYIHSHVFSLYKHSYRVCTQPICIPNLSALTTSLDVGHRRASLFGFLETFLKPSNLNALWILYMHLPFEQENNKHRRKSENIYGLSHHHFTKQVITFFPPGVPHSLYHLFWAVPVWTAWTFWPDFCQIFKLFNEVLPISCTMVIIVSCSNQEPLAMTILN